MTQPLRRRHALEGRSRLTFVTLQLSVVRARSEQQIHIPARVSRETR